MRKLSLPTAAVASLLSGVTLLSFFVLISLLALLSALAAIPAISQTSLSPVGAAVPNRLIVAYRNNFIPTGAEAQLASAGAHIVVRHDRLGILVIQSSASAESLAQLPGIALVAHDRVVFAHAIKVRAAASPALSTASDALYNSPQGWAVRQVGGFGGDASTPASAPGPWTVTKGAGIRIAILDSGVDATHPDIAPNLAFNLSEVDQTAATGVASPCDDGSPQDQQGHGTWTASLAAAALGPNTGQVAGVAPAATLLNIKVLQRMPSVASDPTTCAEGQAAGLLSWVLQGMEDAVAQRADIVSMSLGTLVDITTGDGAGLQAIFNQATHAAANAGVILIAAAGNDGFNFSNPQYIELPAQSRDVLALAASTNPACAENLNPGATCAAGPVTLPYYSNFGTPLNALAAPGGSYPAGSLSDPSQASGWITGACSAGLPSTVTGLPSDSSHSFGCFGLGHVPYVQAMGTSASAPLAAGVAALILAAHPTWSAATVVAAMRSTAASLPGLPVALVSAVGSVTPAPVHTDPVIPAPTRF